MHSYSELTTQLYEIRENNKNIQDIKQKMTIFLEQIFDQHWRPAVEYYITNKLDNRKLIRLTNRVINDLTRHFMNFDIDATIILSHALNTNTNLWHESPIDVSVFVDNLDNAAAIEIGKKIAAMNFKYNKLVNPFKPNTTYYSFTIFIEQHEFELRLYNKQECKVMLNLYQYLQTNLSMPEKIAIGYGKKIFAGISTHALITFQELVFSRYLAEFPDGFISELHYKFLHY